MSCNSPIPASNTDYDNISDIIDYINEKDLKDDTDYRRGLEDGTRRTRDDIICTMIGFQNDCCSDINNPEYKAYQKVMDYVEKSFGESMKSAKLL